MRLSRGYQTGKEFRERQGAFDFATVALAVLDVAVDVVKSLGAWWRKVRPMAPVAAVKAGRQMVLELDSIAQAPLFRL